MSKINGVCEFNQAIECVCPNTECERHGKCCACVAAHVEKGNFPACLRPNAEKLK